jgi:cellulose synthase/poly-beta-1,6-N-acetylglucosamine synthase-like glycosyltransferase
MTALAESGVTTAATLPRVAVVLIGRNEGERLRACIESVLAMEYPRELVEVIYVDSASTDASVAIAKNLGVKTIVLDGPTTAARGRNAGWTATDVEFVLFLDGDTVLAPGFVASAIGHFNDSIYTDRIAGVYGNRRESGTADSIYNAIFDLDWNAEPGFARFFGGDALVRREALAEAGGYNPALIAGEEPDLCRRLRGLGYRILHVNEPMTQHDLAMYTAKQYWRRSVRTGYAYAEVSAMYAKTDDPLWLAESQSNITRGVFWTTAPVLAVLLSLGIESCIPLTMFLLAALALIVRTAVKARNRVRPLKLLAAYSVHSHLQQVPIFIGQLRFWLARRRGRGEAIIEYKKAG